MVNAEIFTEEQLKELAFTKEEREMLTKARLMPITFDDGCLPTTPERALKFRRVNPPRGREMCKAMEEYGEKREMIGIVKVGKNLGWTDDQIISRLVEIYKITEEAAKALFVPDNN